MNVLFMEIYNGIMDAKWNPLSKIPDIALRHLLMQLLAWMWCIVFSLYFSLRGWYLDLPQLLIFY
jgi:hypothetical protein